MAHIRKAALATHVLMNFQAQLLRVRSSVPSPQRELLRSGRARPWHSPRPQGLAGGKCRHVLPFLKAATGGSGNCPRGPQVETPGTQGYGVGSLLVVVTVSGV